MLEYAVYMAAFDTLVWQVESDLVLEIIYLEKKGELTWLMN